MYLDGQLPRGPASSNQGGQITRGAVSALFDGESSEPIDSPMPQDLSGSTFFTLPDGGPVVVSPSVGTINGVVQYPVHPMRGFRRGDQKPERIAPAGYAPQNPGDWEPAACGLDGLGVGADNGGMDPAVFMEHFGHAAPDPETCRKIQCGEITQEQAGPSLLFDCGNFGYAGVRSCVDPVCAPGCAPSLITPGESPPPVAPRSPAPPNIVIAPPKEGCFGYGADGSLITLRNDAGRNAGLSDCCQSGYHSFEDFTIPEPAAGGSAFPWLLGLAGAALLFGSSRKGRRA